MKKLIAAISFIALSLTVSAHHLVRGCWINGRYSLIAVDAPIGGTMKVSLHSGTANFGNGTKDTIINVTSANVSFTVPQPVRTTVVDVYVTYSDGITNQIFTGTNTCSALSIKQILTNYTTDSEGNTVIYITVDDDSDVDQFRVVDRKTNKVYLVLFPDDRKGTKTYVVTLK